MGSNTKIEWTDATWNPIRGCSRVSEGCRNCYAERVAARFSGPGMAYEGLAKMTPSGPRWTGKIRLIEKHLGDPLRWKQPKKIFVNSMSDLFHEDIDDDVIEAIFGVMALARHHTYQILTKRGNRMREWFRKYEEMLKKTWKRGTQDFASAVAHRAWKFGIEGDSDLMIDVPYPLPNVWLGVSVEDQETADKRIPMLLNTPAAVRFVSAEPLLGPVDLPWVWPSCIQPTQEDHDKNCDSGFFCDERNVDWVVAGGESGPNARPMHRKWVEDIRDQCTSAGIAFHFKQWGEWAPTGPSFGTHYLEPNGKYYPMSGRPIPDEQEEIAIVHKVGKKNAGRFLEGRTWDEFPSQMKHETTDRSNG